MRSGQLGVTWNIPQPGAVAIVSFGRGERQAALAADLCRRSMVREGELPGRRNWQAEGSRHPTKEISRTAKWCCGFKLFAQRADQVWVADGLHFFRGNAGDGVSEALTSDAHFEQAG